MREEFLVELTQKINGCPKEYRGRNSLSEITRKHSECPKEYERR